MWLKIQLRKMKKQKTQPYPLNSQSTVGDKHVNRQNTAHEKFKTLFFWDSRKENDFVSLAGGGRY